ncbi:hypothetical protein F4824DRAFT_506824 [Ustulina deusta]|nr:hypothetical protein F4824DRAFT_506824 [Ustulina deusta]
MLNYLEKSRHFTHPGPSRLLNSTTRYDPSAFYRDGGPLQASSPNNLRPFSTFLGSAFEALDVVQNNGFNSGSLLGSQFCTTTIDPTTGTRSSSQTSFLDAAQSQPNLKIYPETLATRITFDAHKRATGLLMVSGIGPASTLRRLHIPVIADRPGVGQNMTDHVMFGPTYRVQVEILATIASNPVRLASEITNYLATGQGPLSNQGCEYIAWEKKAPRDMLSEAAARSLSALPDSWLHIEYLSADSYFGNWSVPLNQTPADGDNYASLLVILVYVFAEKITDVIKNGS